MKETEKTRVQQTRDFCFQSFTWDSSGSLNTHEVNLEGRVFNALNKISNGNFSWRDVEQHIKSTAYDIITKQEHTSRVSPKRAQEGRMTLLTLAWLCLGVLVFGILLDKESASVLARCIIAAFLLLSIFLAYCRTVENEGEVRTKLLNQLGNYEMVKAYMRTEECAKYIENCLADKSFEQTENAREYLRWYTMTGRHHSKIIKNYTIMLDIEEYKKLQRVLLASSLNDDSIVHNAIVEYLERNDASK